MNPADQNAARIIAATEIMKAALNGFEASVDTYVATVKEQTAPIIGFFGSAREPHQGSAIAQTHLRYGALCTSVGRLVGLHGFAALGGNCPGIPKLMELGFKSTRTDEGRQLLIGIRIVRPDQSGATFEPTDPGFVDIHIPAPDFDSRVKLMEALCDGAVFGPGGIGTRYELATFIQKRQLHFLYGGRRIPLVFLGKDHWQWIEADFEEMVAAGVLNKDELQYLVTDDAEEAFAYLQAGIIAETSRRSATSSR